MSIENPNKVHQEQQEKSPVIELADSIEKVKALQEKLKEYKERLAQEKKEKPHQSPEYFADTVYKIAIAEKLLLEGKVETFSFGKKLEEELGYFSVDKFQNACGVIDDYMASGGRAVFDGTGFGKKSE